MAEHTPTTAPMPSTITFRPLQAADLPLLHRWLLNPAVARWWDGVADYAAIIAKYTPRIEGLSPTRCYLICDAATPVGYIQTYRPAAYSDYASAIGAADDAASVDVFIGEDSHRWRGFGPLAIRAFLREVVFVDPSITHCLIDPHPDNTVAIRAYQRVGFRIIRHLDDDGSGTPCVLLRIEREAVVPA
jgi:RimJ/RimL family protein N-acetyltransferase